MNDLRRLSRLRQLVGEMTAVNAATPEALAQVQQRRLRALLRHAAANSPYYRERLRGIDVATAPLASLPVLTKRDMMANFDELVTDRTLKLAEVRAFLGDLSNLGRLYRGRFVPFQSSGSSGEYAVTVYSAEELDVYYAAIGGRAPRPRPPGRLAMGREFLRNLLVRRSRAAGIVVTSAPAPSYQLALHAPNMGRVMSWETRAFSILDPIDQIVAQLNEFQPDSLYVYPSMLAQLAHEQLAGRLRLTFRSPLGTISSSSEPLTEGTKELARRAWGKTVQDAYSLSECVVVARACRRADRLHVMSDQCVLEVVDDRNNPVPDGQAGSKVLVTNLFNYTQPFIRYEVPDVTGYSTEPCGCGWPFPTLLQVAGRTYETFYISAPSGGFEAVSPYRLRGAIFGLDELCRSQLVQTGRDVFTLRYVPTVDGDAAPRIRERLAAGMRKASLDGRVRLELERVESIARHPRSGKYVQFVSEVGAPRELRHAEEN